MTRATAISRSNISIRLCKDQRYIKNRIIIIIIIIKDRVIREDADDITPNAQRSSSSRRLPINQRAAPHPRSIDFDRRRRSTSTSWRESSLEHGRAPPHPPTADIASTSKPKPPSLPAGAQPKRVAIFSPTQKTKCMKKLSVKRGMEMQPRRAPSVILQDLCPSVRKGRLSFPSLHLNHTPSPHVCMEHF